MSTSSPTLTALRLASAVAAVALMASPALGGTASGRITLENGTDQLANDVHLELEGGRFTAATTGLIPGMTGGVSPKDSHNAGFAGFTAFPGESVDIHIDTTISSNVALDLSYYWTKDGDAIKFGTPGNLKKYFRFGGVLVSQSAGGAGYDWEFLNTTDDTGLSLSSLTYAMVSSTFDIDNDTPGSSHTLSDLVLAPGDGTGSLFSAFSGGANALYLAGTAVDDFGARFDFRYLLQVPEPASLPLAALGLGLIAWGRRPWRRRTEPACPPLTPA